MDTSGQRTGTWRPRAAKVKGGGFTAVEMVAVLALASLSATLTIVSLTGLRNRSAMSDIIDHVAMCDDLSRRSAIRLRQPITIILDADQGVISQRNIAAIDDPTAVHVLYRFPGHFKMRQFVIHGGYSMAGSTEISISASGLSASYAIELTDARLTEWLIVSGLTGQTVRTENEQHVFETLGETSRPGDDAR